MSQYSEQLMDNGHGQDQAPLVMGLALGAPTRYVQAQDRAFSVVVKQNQVSMATVVREASRVNKTRILDALTVKIIYRCV
jgi:hypothetical protein